MVQRARPDRVYGSQSSPQRARPGGLECHDLKPFRVLIFPAQRVDPEWMWTKMGSSFIAKKES